MKPLNVKRKKRKEYEKCYFKKAEFVDCDRYVFVSKDEKLDVFRIVAGIDLMLDGKVHVDTGKQLLFEAVACQIHGHQTAGCPDLSISREVRGWAHILHAFCFVEKDRDRSSEMKEQSIETALYNTLARLFPKEEQGASDECPK